MPPDPDPEDPNTERELRRVRQESKDRRLRIQELEELTETMKGDATRLQKDLLKAQSELAARTTELEALRTETTAKIKQLETDLTAKVTEAVAAKDAELATVRSGFETQILAGEVKAAAVAAGVRDADVFLKLVDLSKITRDKDGKLVGVEAMIKAEKEGRSWMFGDPTSTVRPGQQTPPPSNPATMKNAMDMDDGEFKGGLKQFGVRI